jgi:hypothetical protein
MTFRLGQFLDKLLRPIIQDHRKATTFVNGADFIQKFNYYTEGKHRLRPTTIFATIKILNFNTMVPHGPMLIALEDFLSQKLVIPYVENLSIHRILHLTSLFLHNNRFYYQNKIYRFIKGGPNSFSFTETLSNIYVFQCEQILFKELSIRNEFYGR